MAYGTIDIGPGATNRSTTGASNVTRIDFNNLANASGVLTSLEIWCNTDATGCKIGTFSGDGVDTYTSRDYESIGNVTSGSKQTFTGKNCDVSTGDYLAMYIATGTVERDGTSGQTDAKATDAFTGTEQTGWTGSTGPVSIYATGITVPDAPTNVSATDNLTDKVTITWTAGTGETGGHRVYRDGVDISGVVAHGTTTYDDTTAVAGATYSYTVKAINDAGLSAASSADNGTRISSFIPRIMIF